MPELPEVEVVRRGLTQRVVGAQILSVEVFDDRLLKGMVTAERFTHALVGRRMLAVARRGKFLWMPLDRDESHGKVVRPHGSALAVHLGMSGQLLVDGPSTRASSGRADREPARHERVRLSLAGVEGVRRVLHVVDQRMFGSLSLQPLVQTDGSAGAAGLSGDLGPLDAWRGRTAARDVQLERHPWWWNRLPSSTAHIARDVFDPMFDEAGVVAALKRRRAPIKSLLIAQTLVSGIGNIYADEALWVARIHPERSAETLAPVDLHMIFAAVRDVMADALTHGGTSFDAQYKNVNGESGAFATRLHAYGRTSEPCSRCGAPIVRIRFQNRSSHVCLTCQPPVGSNSGADSAPSHSTTEPSCI